MSMQVEQLVRSGGTFAPHLSPSTEVQLVLAFGQR
jgi:hypothetical protein